MTTTDSSTRTAPRNGIDVAALFATLDVVKSNPEIAKFQFRARNRWVSGVHSQSSIQGFYGAMQEDTSRTEPFVYEADHPQVLGGTGHGPTPVEYLLHAIAACLTAGLANIAAARGVTLHEVEATVEGDIDLNGILGTAPAERNGYTGIRVSFRISGDADEATLRGLVEQSRRRSAVYDALTNATPVDISVAVA
jgi:uncharacterized OsmC-like protein